jgi:copper oxidase (laccase) domain-containing protein
MSGVLPALRWELPYGVRIAYSTAADGDQRDEPRRLAFARPLIGERRLVVPRQVHGIAVVDDRAEDLSQADGVVTADAGTALGAYGADCPGVVIAAPDAVGIAHCGWRGTAGGMVGVLCAAVAARSRAPRASWHAFIGPGISGPRYEVDAPVLSARAWPMDSLSSAERSGHAHLALATVLRRDLIEAGISQIINSGICTCDDPRLHSYRHRGPGAVQLLLTWIGNNI